MTGYGLHAHEVDPAKATGIARYARALLLALQEEVGANESATLITARDCGDVPAPHHVIDIRRRELYLRWLLTRRPRVEQLVPGVDLVHVTAPIVPIATAGPLVVTVHDITPITHPEWYTPRAAFLFRQTIRWARQKADAVIVPSTYVARQVEEHLGLPPSRIHITGYGYEAGHFDDSQGHAAAHVVDEPYLLYLGAVTARKNLVTLIDALPHDGPLLVIAGPDAKGSEEVRAAAARTQARVRFLGRVPEDSLGPLMRGALALVHPSSFEGFGLTVLEAMGCGTPVIVSSEGSLPEVVGPAGHVVPGNDLEGWREGLKVVDDPTELARLQQAGAEWVTRWTWAATASKTLAVYRSVLGSGA